MLSLQQRRTILVLLVNLLNVIQLNNANRNNQCSIDEHNILLHRITPNIDAPIIIQPVTLNNDVGFDSFYQCLTTEYDDPFIANENNDTLQPDEQKESYQAISKSFNFASFDSGAMVLEISDGIKSSKSILSDRKDKYMMMACYLTDKWFVIQLSEDIAVDNMQVTNLEHYSSNIKDIRIYGRTTSDDNDTNSQNWFFISDFQLENKNTNRISFTENHWVRLLKFEILSYYGNEYYCTLTQIKVFGRTMLPHWKNAVIEHFDEVDLIKQNINNSTNNNNTVNNMTLQHNRMEQSVFTILTKRISSLELNLTKQQMQVSQLAILFSKIDGLDQRFDEYQINLTNHMLFQSYGISRMLKSVKEKNGTVGDERSEGAGNKTNGMYSDWSQQKSYYNDVLSWKRHEQLERIENYMESLLLMVSNLFWIGLFIILSQVVMAICFIGYVCGCCDSRKSSRSSRKHISSNKHRITAASASNRSTTRNKFAFSKTYSQLSLKRKNNRKRLKK